MEWLMVSGLALSLVKHTKSSRGKGPAFQKYDCALRPIGRDDNSAEGCFHFNYGVVVLDTTDTWAQVATRWLLLNRTSPTQQARCNCHSQVSVFISQSISLFTRELCYQSGDSTFTCGLASQ